jgi:hypothetical protein
MINGAEYQRRFGDVDSDFEDVVKKVPRRKRTKKKGKKRDGGKLKNHDNETRKNIRVKIQDLDCSRRDQANTSFDSVVRIR